MFTVKAVPWTREGEMLFLEGLWAHSPPLYAHPLAPTPKNLFTEITQRRGTIIFAPSSRLMSCAS